MRVPVGRVQGLAFVLAGAALGACGGTTANGEASPGPHDPDAGSDGARPRVRVTDGSAPIFDCAVWDPAAEQTQGCNVFEPPALTDCNVPGTTCHYHRVVVEDGFMYQSVFTCSGDPPNWGNGANARCGQTCGRTTSNVIEFDSSSCRSHAPVACDDGKGAIYVAPPSGYDLVVAMLQATLEACNASISDNLVELSLTDGCPTRLASSGLLDADAIGCLERHLSGVRWQCAARVPCASYFFSLL